ncbi:MAG: hypothetical protein AAF705_17870, partial [Bacteroidota bacterium]
KTHEIGLRTSNLEDFSLIYKKQKRPNQFIRYRLLFASASYQERMDQNLFRGNIGIAIGKENRKNISERFQFLHGFEPAISISSFNQTSNNAFNLNLNLGYVIGFQYEFAEHFYFNVETIPRLSLAFTFRENNIEDAFSANAQLNSTVLTVGLIHQFQTLKK